MCDATSFAVEQALFDTVFQHCCHVYRIRIFDYIILFIRYLLCLRRRWMEIECVRERERERESEHGNKLNDRTMCSYSMASEWNKAFSQIVCIHGKSLNYMHCTMYNIYLYHTEHTEYNNANKIKTCSTRVKWAQQSSGGKKHQKLKWYSIRQLVVVHFLEGPSYRSVWLSLSPSPPPSLCMCIRALSATQIQ